MAGWRGHGQREEDCALLDYCHANSIYLADRDLDLHICILRLT